MKMQLNDLTVAVHLSMLIANPFVLIPLVLTHFIAIGCFVCYTLDAVVNYLNQRSANFSQMFLAILFLCHSYRPLEIASVR